MLGDVLRKRLVRGVRKGRGLFSHGGAPLGAKVSAKDEDADCSWGASNEEREKAAEGELEEHG